MVTQEDLRTSIQPEAATARVAIVHAAETAAPQPHRAHVKTGVLLALATSVLLWMSFFPLAWGWLSWVALVPFLGLVRMNLSTKALFWCSYLAGSAFFWPVIQWMRVADARMYGCWALLSLYCAFYFPAALALMRRLERTPLPFCLNVAFVWVGLEYIRSFALTGFAWYYLGHAQHDFLTLIQIADLGGAYAVSFVVALVNAAVFLVVYQMGGVRQALGLNEPPPSAIARRIPWNVIAQGTLVFFVVLGALAYGSWRLDGERFTPGPRVALLQMNIDQRIRNQMDDASEEASYRARKHVFDHMIVLCLRAGQQRPDLVVWPETSYFQNWYEYSTDIPLQDIPPIWKRLQGDREQHFGKDILYVCPTNHLLGLSTGVLSADKAELRYNSALLMNALRHNKGRYDKMHRVPFGEYVPFRDWLPIMDWLSPYDWNYSIRPGDTFTRFELGDYRFGTIICYEDTDPFLARRYVRDEKDGKPVHFLVNISNDGWFDGTSEHNEHLAISRFRAVECRRSLVRAVNMGISAVIDGSGRILKPTDIHENLPETTKLPPEVEAPTTWQVMQTTGKPEPLPVGEWNAFKKTYGLILASVPIDERYSLYAHYGDWLPLAACAVIAALWLWTLTRCTGLSKPTA
jgi:apolipoprotein N-acyltransferase